MFACFFPRPRVFLLSAILWIAFTVCLWRLGARDWGAAIGLPPDRAGQPQAVSVADLWSKSSLWFYAYYWTGSGLFWLAWRLYAPHRWARWSILCPAFIGFATHINATLNVMANRWAGPFYNMVQASLGHTGHAALADYNRQFLTIVEINLAAVAFVVTTAFFSSHFVFRWRTAMNDYYAAHWHDLRAIEGAAQRVQEDTMRFASLLECICVNGVASVMILVAFLPILAGLSAKVTVLPIFHHLPYGLVTAALLWAMSATAVLALMGRKLPSLEMRNQKVEAAYRKELVYGEDNPDRAAARTLKALFTGVRTNYFALYQNMLFFNVARFSYIYIDGTVALFLLLPSILAGAITFGLFYQIISAFENVRRSFEYLANQWPEIMDLLSVHGRLRTFEAAIGGAKPPLADVSLCAAGLAANHGS